MKTFTPGAQLEPLLAQMSRDMAVPVEGLVNQAIFNWAKLHGYLEPGNVEAVPAPPPQPADEPETSRATPVVEEPESMWKLASGGSFSAPHLEPITDGTAPSVLKQRLIVLALAEREVVVDSERFLVGRDVSCDLTIDSARISRQHAVIRVGRDGTVEVEDLGSSNGTWYQGKRIERRKLVHGDEVAFGDTGVRVEFR